MDTTKSIGIQGKISPARTERQNSAFENYLIRFFERELEVKLTRREMWRNISLHCLAFDTGDECSPTLPLAFFMSIG